LIKDVGSKVMDHRGNPLPQLVMYRENKPQTIMESRKIKVTEINCYPTKSENRQKEQRKLLYLEPLLAVLIPEVESTIRSSSCKCVMDLQQVVKKI
jgi:hypothetical protein